MPSRRTLVGILASCTKEEGGIVYVNSGYVFKHFSLLGVNDFSCIYGIKFEFEIIERCIIYFRK